MDTKPTSLFGKIAITAGYLTEEKLKGLLEAQAEERKAGLKVTLGELARERRVMTAEQVQHTLLVQEFTLLREDGKRLGARAVKLGMLSEDQVAEALDAQRKEYQTSKKVPPRFEEMLLAQGLLTSEQVEKLNEAQDDGEDSAPPSGAPKPPSPEEVTGTLSIEGGQRFPLGKQAILGRLPTCDVMLPDPRASRQHARIQFEAGTGRHAITDLNTPNGTRVNDKRISGIVLLNPGDRIGIGSLVIRYDRQAPPPAAPLSLDDTRIAPSKGPATDPHAETVDLPPSPRPQAGRPPRKL